MSKQDLYETIFQTTVSLFAVFDREGRIVMFNPACERTCGYRFEEVRGRVFWDFLLTPEEQDPVRRVFENLCAGHFPNTYQNYWLTKSGGLRFIEWSNSAITDDKGVVTFVIGTGIDCTDKANVQLRLAEITNTLPIALWVQELSANRMSYVSPGFWKICGLNEQSADSAMRAFSNAVHPEDREPLFKRMLVNARTGFADDTEFRIMRGNGMTRWIRARSFPVRNDHSAIVRVIGYAEDITDRKSEQQALENLRGRQSAILNAISDSVFLKDADFRYIEVNSGFLDRHGFGRDQVIGKTAREIFPEAEAAAIEERDRQVFHSGQPLRSEVIRTVSGERRFYDVLRHPVIDGAGCVTGIVATSRDISERKIVESQRIEREVALRNTLVREVHHRIKNNLQGVVSLLDQFSLRHPELAEPIANLGTRLNAIALVHGLQSGMLNQDLNFCSVANAIATEARVLHGEDVLSLGFEPGFQAVELGDAEAVPIALIVNELISNALKHASPDALRPIAHIQLQRTPPAVHLRVRNFTGKLPSPFDFPGGIGLGTGLRLVRSLLPPTGAALEISDCLEGGVEAVLTLTSPIVCDDAKNGTRLAQ